MELGIHVGYLYIPRYCIEVYATWAWLSMLDTVICQTRLCLIFDRFELEDHVNYEVHIFHSMHVWHSHGYLILSFTHMEWSNSLSLNCPVIQKCIFKFMYVWCCISFLMHEPINNFEVYYVLFRYLSLSIVKTRKTPNSLWCHCSWLLVLMFRTSVNLISKLTIFWCENCRFMCHHHVCWMVSTHSIFLELVWLYITLKVWAWLL